MTFNLRSSGWTYFMHIVLKKHSITVSASYFSGSNLRKSDGATLPPQNILTLNLYLSYLILSSHFFTLSLKCFRSSLVLVQVSLRSNTKFWWIRHNCPELRRLISKCFFVVDDHPELVMFDQKPQLLCTIVTAHFQYGIDKLHSLFLPTQDHYGGKLYYCTYLNRFYSVLHSWLSALERFLLRDS